MVLGEAAKPLISHKNLAEFHEPCFTPELKPLPGPGSGSAHGTQPALTGLFEVTSVPQALPAPGLKEQPTS